MLSRGHSRWGASSISSKIAFICIEEAESGCVLDATVALVSFF